MRFSLNLVNIVSKMGNEYDEEIQDFGWDKVHKIVEMIGRGEIELEVVWGGTGWFLEIDVPKEILEG